MYWIFEVIGLIIGFIGSLLLLIEPIRIRLKEGRTVLFTNEKEQKKYNKRIRIGNIGIILIAIGFGLQALAVIWQNAFT